MGADFNELENYVKNFRKMSIEFNKFLFDFLTKNALEALAKTKKRTPVDTGELRRNWEITRVIKRGDELLVYLYNGKDYASYVEEGHTTRNREGWVEGYYMATISIEEVERNIPKRFDREFIRFMAELGVN
ncbi:HK97 gp10 family phage protein [Clostridium perfringens]|uniref:HK97 gp10 family phage protein n=1 Tax=Clostridium perfringens TaxID=1502 RepID=UPI001241C8D2|nr:HK97 gp10 family phage protein [Clostridium perfringens]MDT9337333.1 HK97 gp10 family phage protein [Clostridium perfringens]MDT9345089.1 HK97 gp10 family phage protein [Clostridium perfringens]MDT9348167.1 HK97 gp10 family phage protein [Clostridium perfringens]MDT9354176.1 HK97 gp10 family phage protein [Clostridium perfringens]MDU1966865.1 HK97 gp10 family phage protein [Clostridium perfringens]